MLLTEYRPFKTNRQLAEQAIKENKPLIVSGVLQRDDAENQEWCYSGRQDHRHPSLLRRLPRCVDGDERLMGFQDRDYNRYYTGSGYGGGGMRRAQGGFHWPAATCADPRNGIVQ